MNNPFAGMRARRWLPIVGLLMTGAVVNPAGAVAAPQPSCSDTAASDAAAAAMAKACGREVVVGPSRSEYAQVVAAPDGRLRFESAVVPQRVRQQNGDWAGIDLSLKSGVDGLRPAVSPADVAFSPGGSGPLVTLRHDGKTMTMSWPGSLPAPVVSGDSAAYQNVLADVDLVVRATRTGFTHVLVVKTPAAAAHVRKVRFGLGGDVQVTQLADGSLQARSGTQVIARAGKAFMWDSKGAASTARAAGDTARIRPVGVAISPARELVLEPAISASDSYPLYIDPNWDYGAASGQKWAYATNNNETNTDYATARVGRRPDNGTVYRSFFEFPTTSNGVSLNGKHIQSAYVQMYLTHSSSCSNQNTYMYLTPAINATMKASWSSMSLSTYLSAQAGHANEAGGCGVIQPDMTMNFGGSTVTNQLQTAATGNWGTVTMGFAARDTGGGGESTSDRWMKYLPDNAKLVVEYDSIPGKPSSLQVAGVACSSGVLTVGTLTPTVSAVYPDADSGQTLTGTYERIEVPAGGIGTVTDTSPARLSAPNSATATAGGRATTSALPTLTKGKTYAFRVKTTDPDPYFRSSPWSDWCQFAVDTSVPQVSVTVVTAPAGPGKQGTFKITSTATDVTKFKYGWGAATTEVAASGTPKSATVTATAPKFGQNILSVSAVDATLNEGFGSTEFTVGRPSPAVARWGLETYPGMTQAGALADQQPSLAGNTPLTTASVTWQNDARLVGGQTLSVDGNNLNAAKTTASVVNTSNSFSVALWVRPSTCTGGSDTVASAEGTRASSFMLDRFCSNNKWRLATHTTDVDGGGTATNVWATGTVVEGRWQYLAAVYDAPAKQTRLYLDGVLQSTGNVTGIFAAGGPFVLGMAKWNGTLGQVYHGEIADVQVFDRVLVDHDFTGLLGSDPASGGFNEPGILAPIQVGEWDFNAATPCYTANLRDTCEAPDATGWNRWLSLSRGAEIGAGRSTSDGGLRLDNAYFPGDGNTETGTREHGRSAYKTGTTPPDGDGLEYSTWQNSAVVRTDQSFTVSTWVNITSIPNSTQTILAQDGGVYVSGFYLGVRFDTATQQHKWTFTMHDSDVANGSGRYAKASNPITAGDLGRWTHLTAVYDAARSELRLYVNGVRQGTDTRPSYVVPWHAAGPLTVGRAWFHGAEVDWFMGAVDDVQAYQGAMTDTAAFEAYNSQIAPKPGTNTWTHGWYPAGSYLRSNANNYELKMQSDGNLVLYQAGYALWDSGTWGNPGAELGVQADGNMVIYKADKTPIWHTATTGSTAQRLVLHDDGNLVLYGSSGQVVWRR